MYERRALTERVEFRSEGTTMVASGVAIRYESRSKVMVDDKRGAFREQVLPGAAARHLGNPQNDVLALHEHDVRMLLGRTSNGTLTLTDSPTELRYEVVLPDTTLGHDVAAQLERGDIAGSSFGFRAMPDTVEWTVEDGLALRSIGALSLRDVSTTCLPAYEQTTAEVAFRSLGLDDSEVRSILEAAGDGLLPDLLQLRGVSPAFFVGDPETDESETPRETPRLGHLVELTI